MRKLQAGPETTLLAWSSDMFFMCCLSNSTAILLEPKMRCSLSMKSPSPVAVFPPRRVIGRASSPFGEGACASREGETALAESSIAFAKRAFCSS